MQGVQKQKESGDVQTSHRRLAALYDAAPAQRRGSVMSPPEPTTSAQATVVGGGGMEGQGFQEEQLQQRSSESSGAAEQPNNNKRSRNREKKKAWQQRRQTKVVDAAVAASIAKRDWPPCQKLFEKNIAFRGALASSISKVDATVDATVASTAGQLSHALELERGGRLAAEQRNSSLLNHLIARDRRDAHERGALFVLPQIASGHRLVHLPTGVLILAPAQLHAVAAWTACCKSFARVHGESNVSAPALELARPVALVRPTLTVARFECFLRLARTQSATASWRSRTRKRR